MARIHLQASSKNTRKANAAEKWATVKTRNGATQAGISANGEAQATAKDKKISDRIYRYLKQEQWLKARALIKQELKKAPESHWLWMMLGHTFYERFDYGAALAPAQKAVSLQPECPLALSYYGGTLDMLGRTEEAIATYQRILDREVEEIAYDECGEGLRRAMEIQNDCQFRIARGYLRLGNKKAARVCLSKYVHNRSHGVRSNYSLRKAKAMLAEASE